MKRIAQALLLLAIVFAGNVASTSWPGPPYTVYSFLGHNEGAGTYQSIGEATAAFNTAFYSVPQDGCTYDIVFYDHMTGSTTVGVILWAGYNTNFNPPYSCATNGQVGAIDATWSSTDPGRALGNPGCCGAGDPINIGTGNEFQAEEDSPSELEFRRYYNSSKGVSSTHIGAHWRNTYDRSIDAFMGQSTPIANAYRPDGRFVRFTFSDGTWTTAADERDLLVSTTDPSGLKTGWLLFDADARKFETYDLQGRLTAITDIAGQSTILKYSDASTPPSVAPAAGLLIDVTNPKGRQLSLTYDASKRISVVTLPNGDSLQYAYDAIGNLVTVTYPDLSYKTYKYNETDHVATTGPDLPSALTGIVDELQKRYVDITYDSNGWATSSKLGGTASLTKIAYDYTNGEEGATARVTYPSGISANYDFDRSLGSPRIVHGQPCGTTCDSQWANRSYDINGYPSNFVDFEGHETTYAYDALGFLTSRTDAVGAPEARTVNFTWDDTLRVPLTRTLVAGGQTLEFTAWVYNGRGQTVAECEYDPNAGGSLTYSCGSATDAPAGVRQSTYQYCEAVDGIACPLVGLLLAYNGPRADVPDITRYNYYPSADESGCGTLGGSCHRVGDLYQITDAMGRIVTLAAYDKNGHVIRQSDANGVITDFTYQPRGWLLTRTVRANSDGSPSANDAVTSITYTPFGAVASITDPDGVAISYTYDVAHRLTDVTDALGNRLHYTLDAAGNKIREETFDVNNMVRRSLARSYNKLGQLTAVTDGMSHTVFNAGYYDSYDADGNLVHTADALGVQRLQAYDGLNRLISAIDDYDGTNPATKNARTVFAYDARDNLEGVTDPDGLVTTYDHNGHNDLSVVSSPDSGVGSTTYDAAGNPLSQTDARGVTHIRSYDALNRVTAVSYPDVTQNIVYFYDEADGITGCNGSYPVGRLTRVTDNSVSTVFCYDSHGNVARRTQIQGSQTDIVSYSYTPGDRMAGISYPSGTQVNYIRDADGRIQSASLSPAGGGTVSAVSAVSYLPFGPVASYILGNGQTISRSYDANYLLTDVTSPALALHFARDAAGDITALGDAPGAAPATETYVYDSLYRLTALEGAEGTEVEAYTYSKTGDRLSKTGGGLATGSYGYQSGTHWLTTIGTDSRSYDADGHITARTLGGESYVFGYSDRNRMTKAQRNGDRVGSYTYDAFGQRVAKTATLPTLISQRYVYDEASQLLGEYGSSNRDYIWVDNLPVAVVDVSGSSTVAYVHADGLGTPRVVTNRAGSKIWEWPYTSNPYGEQQPVSSGYELNLRFPGQYYDVESELAYNVNRDYEAATGRYLQSDPTGLDGGLSTYAYVLSNPLWGVDTSGLQITAPMPIPWYLPRPMLSPVDPVLLPMSPADYGTTPWVDYEDPSTGVKEQCPGPCKGLLEQLRDHQRKLREYMSNPRAYDNKGFFDSAPPEVHQNIINGRIRELRKQIENFQKQYDACVARHAGGFA